MSFSPDLLSAPADKIFYALTMFPYPSGVGLHAGHASVFTINDVVARYKTMSGYTVLNPFGFDAFGLPTENYALQLKKWAREVTDINKAMFLDQVKALNISFDYERIIDTSMPDYYRWTQWIFTKLMEAGLVYRDEKFVNRCPVDQTVLANDQVVDGCCERCKSEIIQKKHMQWFIKITDYADRLISDLDLIDRPEETKTTQKNWIGKSEWAEIDFQVWSSLSKEGNPQGGGFKTLTVFTTRPDTLYGVTAVVLAPENTLIDELLSEDKKSEIQSYRNTALAKTAVQRQQDVVDKTGVFSWLYATHPLTGESVPVWFADYVLMDYGSGAVMMVPAHDERDREFAHKFGISVKEVIATPLLSGEVGWGSLWDEDYKNNIYHTTGEQKEKLITYARDLRKTQTTGEEIARSLLRDKKYRNMKRRRQHPLGNYIADFYNHEYKIVIELDGPHHDNQKAYDAKRDQYMEDELWLHVIRISSEKFFMEPGIIFDEIDAIVNKDPLPSPLPKGEGTLTNNLSPQEERKEAYTWTWVLTNSAQFDGMDSIEAKSAIIAHLESLWCGKKKITYRLRDRSVSRQRYRGSPIPVYYDENNIPQPIPEWELPVILPLDVTDFKPKWKSPLEDHPTFKYYTPKDNSPLWQDDSWDKQRGQGWGQYLRECDTLDTFMCSSFYFLRFPDAHNDEALIRKELADKCLPVDFYSGGKEHTVGHLLYSRFIHKFLYDQGYVSSPEPFKKLVHQGMVLGADGRKMGKRYNNGVDPLEIVQKYGSDAVRTYLMFMGPIEADKVRNDNALHGMKKFLDRIEKLPSMEWYTTHNDDVIATIHDTIIKVTEDIESYKFNTAVSKLMIAINTIYDHKAIDAEHLAIIAQLLAPFAPILAQQLWEQTWNQSDVSFSSRPVADTSKITLKPINFPIQINGKMRWTLTVSAGISEQELLALVHADESISKYLTGTNKKIIFVADKIMNIINN